MKLPRRQFLHLAAAAAALPAVSRVAWAQSYPTRPVRLIVGYAAGGGTDITARLIGQWLSERFSQQFVIENRPGAATNIATDAVVRAAPDGYTLLLATGGNASNASLYANLTFNFIRDIAPVAGIVRVPNIMLVNQSLPIKTIPEFIPYAKANPSKISMASAGIGSTGHLAGELMKMTAGIDFVHVPYRGNAPAITDLLSGQVQIVFASLPSSIEYVRAGKARGLAVTTAMRAATAPDLPGIAEFVVGYEVSSWYGIGAPRNTPADVVDTLNEAVNAGLADPTLKKQLEDQGGIEMAGTPADFGKLIADETEKWAKLIKFAGIKPQ